MAGSRAHELHTHLVSEIADSKKSFVETGKLLYELKKKGNYRLAVGEGIDTWDDYLAQPEIGLSRSEADRLAQIYEQFVVRFCIDEDRLSDIPIKNLHYLLPLAKTTEDGDTRLDELLHSAATLSQRDFRERVAEIKNPDATRTYEYLIMKRCVETNSLSKVHEYTSEDVDTMIQRYKDQ